jgi:hypothetical protein
LKARELIRLIVRLIEPPPDRARECRRDVVQALQAMRLYVHAKKRRREAASKKQVVKAERLKTAATEMDRAFKFLSPMEQRAIERFTGIGNTLLRLSQVNLVGPEAVGSRPRAPKRDESEKRIAAEHAWFLLRRHGKAPTTTEGALWAKVTAALLYSDPRRGTGLKSQIKIVRRQLMEDDGSLLD